MRAGIDLGTTYCAVARIDENTGKATQGVTIVEFKE